MGSASIASSGSSLFKAFTLTLAATAVAAAKSKTKSAKSAAATKANTIEIVGLTGVSGKWPPCRLRLGPRARVR